MRRRSAPRARGLDALTVEEWERSARRVAGSFDALLVAHMVEHMTEPEALAILADHLPYLRPGGRLLLVCPQESGYRSDPTHVRSTDDRALVSLARKMGLDPGQWCSFPFPRAAGRAFRDIDFCLLATKPL